MKWKCRLTWSVDLLCRSYHRAIARQVGGGWDAYLDGLLALLHYAEHGNADVRDMTR